jgi:hypothetical protein
MILRAAAPTVRFTLLINPGLEIVDEEVDDNGEVGDDWEVGDDLEVGDNWEVGGNCKVGNDWEVGKLLGGRPPKSG